MPKCLNDAKKYFRGDEPSPKGRGFCAASESIGTKKKGVLQPKRTSTQADNSVRV